MSALQAQLGEYLRLRRALGFKLVEAGHVLPQFVAFLQTAGAETITVELAVAWARQPENAQPIHWAHRLGAVRGFARWLASIDPATEVPPAGVFAARQHRRAPYIYTSDELATLVDAARPLLRPPLRAASYQALFGLLACSGMRLGEAITLDRPDVDLDEGLVTVRHAKYGRERLVPLHRTATDALRGYATERDRLCPAPDCGRFFLSGHGGPLTLSGTDHTFTRLADTLGLRTPTRRPRIHDIRHTVTVQILTGWYRGDVEDIAARLPLLSTLLGHVNPASLYWYLSAVPELMQLAAARLPDRAAAMMPGARS